jgi:hypothetical protein
MAVATIRCPVLGADVSRVTDFEGRVTRVICPEYREPLGICRIRSGALAGGPLSRFLEGVAEDTLAQRGVRCELG